jgi:hypothetical protein
MALIPTVEVNRMDNADAWSNAEPRCCTPWTAHLVQTHIAEWCRHVAVRR